MNIHPIFVHFPIALLSVYSLFELLRFRRLTELHSWKHIKAALLLTGIGGALIALATGDMAAEQLRGSLERPLIEAHESWASGASAIYGILAGAYLIDLIQELATGKLKVLLDGSRLFTLVARVKNVILKSSLAVILALIGLVAMTVTGGLGGAIVYGPDIDPVVSLIYRLVIGK